MQKVLVFCEEENLGFKASKIYYGQPSDKFIQESYENLNLDIFMFIKSSKYQNQNEYRIVFNEESKRKMRRDVLWS